MFREGRDATKDQHHSGRPQVENQKIQHAADLLEADRPRELAAALGKCHKAVLHILQDILGYRKITARLIPHKVSDVHCWHRYALAQDLLNRYRREGDNFIGRIVTMEETWARSYEPRLKRQSNERSIRAVWRSLRDIKRSGFADGVRRLPVIWQKVVDMGGDYIE